MTADKIGSFFFQILGVFYNKQKEVKTQQGFESRLRLTVLDPDISTRYCITPTCCYKNAHYNLPQPLGLFESLQLRLVISREHLSGRIGSANHSISPMGDRGPIYNPYLSILEES